MVPHYTQSFSGGNKASLFGSSVTVNLVCVCSSLRVSDKHGILSWFTTSSDAPIMIFRGRFRYRFFLSKLADSDSDTDFFSFKQPTRNNERF